MIIYIQNYEFNDEFEEPLSYQYQCRSYLLQNKKEKILLLCCPHLIYQKLRTIYIYIYIYIYSRRASRYSCVHTPRPANDDRTPKNKQFFIKYYFVSNEVSTCSGWCCWILQLCDVFKGVYGGLNGTIIHQYLRNVCRKMALLKSFKFATFKELNSQSFWTTRLILVLKEAELCDLHNYRDFFLIFEVWKNYAVWNIRFLGKNEFFLKQRYNSKSKMKFEKNSL